MQKDEIVLRLATDRDIRNLYKWRNSAKSREMSLNSEHIDFEDHKRWFSNVKNDSRYLIYVAELNFTSIGSIRIFFKKNSEAEISIVIEEKFQQKGLGSKILQKAIKEVTENIKETLTLIATIKKNNLSSIKIFQKCGFVENSSLDSESFSKFYLILNS